MVAVQPEVQPSQVKSWSVRRKKKGMYLAVKYELIVMVIPQYSLVDAHLIATTLPGPGQRYKLYIGFCYFLAQACLGI